MKKGGVIKDIASGGHIAQKRCFGGVINEYE